MPRLIAIVLAVGVLWTIVEVYAYGTQGAFGGKLAGIMGESSAAPPERSLTAPRRAGEAVERAHELQQERYQDLLGD